MFLTVGRYYIRFLFSRPNRETLSTVLSTVTRDANVVLGGSTAGGVGAFNIAAWLLETFDQVPARLLCFCGMIVSEPINQSAMVHTRTEDRCM